ncbi:MAG: daunorubicin ABC transporter ATP-binding protein [Desulfurococcales archaeon ex4484_217_2]|nr:MAG: daunorubicin ABC transporter ATP-binding protein [Desulfurococcales archaeon ex4484_217_2]
MDAISVKGVSKHFKDVTALDNVTFNVRKGEIFSLLGPNGAGKTTLLKIICGILPPDSGEVKILGINVSEKPFEAKRKIGYVPQESIVYDKLNGWENIVFYASLYGLSSSQIRSRAEELIRRLGLENHVKKLVKTYSGGLRKRLSLAVSLIHDPEILILDEPTVGLDPSARREFWKIIEGLREDGVTVLMATHYMEEADVLSDRVAIINEGKIIAIGSPDELKKAFGELTVIEISVANPKPGIEEFLEEFTEGSILVKNNKVRIHVRGYESSLPKIVESLLKNGVKIVQVSIAEPTLEDVFLKLTGRGLGE